MAEYRPAWDYAVAPLAFAVGLVVLLYVPLLVGGPALAGLARLAGAVAIAGAYVVFHRRHRDRIVP